MVFSTPPHIWTCPETRKKNFVKGLKQDRDGTKKVIEEYQRLAHDINQFPNL